MSDGPIFQAGRRIYARCVECGGFICTNKRIFGSLHLCAPAAASPTEEEER